MSVVEEAAASRECREKTRVGDNDEELARSREGDAQAAHVGDETERALAGTRRRDNDNVGFGRSPQVETTSQAAASSQLLALSLSLTRARSLSHARAWSATYIRATQRSHVRTCMVRARARVCVCV